MIKNYQWKITKYGLETQANNDEYKDEYSIAAADLFELIERDGICIFRAILPLLGREWVIGDELVEIYPHALKFHSQRLKKEYDEAKVKAAMDFFVAHDTYQKGREVRAKLLND